MDLEWKCRCFPRFFMLIFVLHWPVASMKGKNAAKVLWDVKT